MNVNAKKTKKQVKVQDSSVNVLSMEEMKSKIEGTYGTVEDEIALSLREDKMMVQMALSAMKKVNLVVMGMDDMEMQFTRIGEMVGIDSESASAKRVREHRARKALEQQQVLGVTMKQGGNAVVTNGNTEIEKETEREKESDVETEGLGLYRNVFLTPEEFQNLKDLYPADYMQKINNLSVYMVSAKKNYQSHYMTICRWARDVGRILRTFKIKKNVEVTDNGKIII